MTASAVIVIIIVISVVATLALTRVPPDAVLVGAVALLLTTPVPTQTGWQLGILDVHQALAGFSNPGLATVGVLFVVVAGLRETGGIDWIAENMLGRPRTVRQPAEDVVAFDKVSELVSFPTRLETHLSSGRDVHDPDLELGDGAACPRESDPLDILGWVEPIDNGHLRQAPGVDPLYGQPCAVG